LRRDDHNLAKIAPQSPPPIGIGTTQDQAQPKMGWTMTEQQERLARERAEIAERVKNFRATQKKFEQEREDYYKTTLSNAWDGFNRPVFWN
jgi:hypothetical protein